MSSTNQPSADVQTLESKTIAIQSSETADTPPALLLTGEGSINPWLVLLSIMLGFFMSLLDATITNIALVDIQTGLNTDLSTVSWVINAYTISFAALLVTMGRFADQFGRKRIFMTGMIIFSLASLLCALAPSIELLILFRIVQGAGAAGLNSVSLAIITGVFPPHKRGAAIGIWGALAALAAAVGPVLGGFLLSIPVLSIGGIAIASWRWIFFINLPFCLAGLAMIARNVPEMRDEHASRRIDLLGLLTLSVAMICVAIAIIQGNDWRWDSRIFSLAIAGVVALLLFIIVELRQVEPILDLALFQIRSFSAANIVMFLFGVAAQGAFLMVPLYLINVQGSSELNTAYTFLPLPLSAFIVSAVASRLMQQINAKYLTITAMIVFGLGFVALTSLHVEASYGETAWRLGIVGIGLGLGYVTLPAMVLAEIPRPKLGVASGTFNTFRQFGFVIGVALLVSLLGALATNSLTGTALHQAQVNAFHACWGVSAIIALSGVIPALFTVSPQTHRPATNDGQDTKGI